MITCKTGVISQFMGYGGYYHGESIKNPNYTPKYRLSWVSWVANSPAGTKKMPWRSSLWSTQTCLQAVLPASLLEDTICWNWIWISEPLLMLIQQLLYIVNCCPALVVGFCLLHGSDGSKSTSNCISSYQFISVQSSKSNSFKPWGLYPLVN